jgi:hypothetical protein
MDCCGLFSTGLKDIDANNITSDNITSFLNVSGFPNLIPEGFDPKFRELHVKNPGIPGLF